MNSATLDRASGVPLYRQIKQILIDEMRAGAGADGLAMTEEALLTRFHVSRAPVRQALKELVAEGYVYRERAKGTFPVQGLNVQRPATLQLGGLMGYLREQGLSPEATVHGVSRVVPTAEVRKNLGLSASEKAFTFTRVITVKDEKLVSSQVFLCSPPEFDPTSQELTDAGSAFELLKRAYGIDFTRSEHHVWASGAKGDDALALEVSEGEPILVVETLLLTRDGRPGGWRRAIHRADDFKYVFTSNR
jgi:GntR family transcriptional regulator